jgi:hypothetical protein
MVVAEGTASDGELNSELSLVEGRKEGEETINGIGEDDSQASIKEGYAAGADKDVGVDRILCSTSMIMPI